MLHVIFSMIVNFKQDWLEEFWNTGYHKKVPSELSKRLLHKIDMMQCVRDINDLSSPPSNHLHKLHGDREGQWAVSVNGPWRLCFVFKDGDIFNLELVQYH